MFVRLNRLARAYPVPYLEIAYVCRSKLLAYSEHEDPTAAYERHLNKPDVGSLL